MSRLWCKGADRGDVGGEITSESEKGKLVLSTYSLALITNLIPPSCLSLPYPPSLPLSLSLPLPPLPPPLPLPLLVTANWSNYMLGKEVERPRWKKTDRDKNTGRERNHWSEKERKKITEGESRSDKKAWRREVWEERRWGRGCLKGREGVGG